MICEFMGSWQWRAGDELSPPCLPTPIGNRLPTRVGVVTNIFHDSFSFYFFCCSSFLFLFFFQTSELRAWPLAFCSLVNSVGTHSDLSAYMLFIKLAKVA